MLDLLSAAAACRRLRAAAAVERDAARDDDRDVRLIRVMTWNLKNNDPDPARRFANQPGAGEARRVALALSTSRGGARRAAKRRTCCASRRTCARCRANSWRPRRCPSPARFGIGVIRRRRSPRPRPNASSSRRATTRSTATRRGGVPRNRGARARGSMGTVRGVVARGRVRARRRGTVRVGGRARSARGAPSRGERGDGKTSKRVERRRAHVSDDVDGAATRTTTRARRRRESARDASTPAHRVQHPHRGWPRLERGLSREARQREVRSRRRGHPPTTFRRGRSVVVAGDFNMQKVQLHRRLLTGEGAGMTRSMRLHSAARASASESVSSKKMSPPEGDDGSGAGPSRVGPDADADAAGRDVAADFRRDLVDVFDALDDDNPDARFEPLDAGVRTGGHRGTTWHSWRGPDWACMISSTIAKHSSITRNSRLKTERNSSTTTARIARRGSSPGGARAGKRPRRDRRALRQDRRRRGGERAARGGRASATHRSRVRRESEGFETIVASTCRSRASRRREGGDDSASEDVRRPGEPKCACGAALAASREDRPPWSPAVIRGCACGPRGVGQRSFPGGGGYPRELVAGGGSAEKSRRGTRAGALAGTKRSPRGLGVSAGRGVARVVVDVDLSLAYARRGATSARGCASAWRGSRAPPPPAPCADSR